MFSQAGTRPSSRSSAATQNVVRIEKNGEVLLNKPFSEEAAQPPESRRSLTVEDIIAFADEVDLDDVRVPIARQIEYNTAIAEAG